jgi:hypothetical protein
MIYAIYIFAVIGAVVVTLVLLFFLSWWFIHVVGKAQLRKQERAVTLTPTQSQ